MFGDNGSDRINFNINKTINLEHLNSIITYKFPKMIKVGVDDSELNSNRLAISSIIYYSTFLTLSIILISCGLYLILMLLNKTVIYVINRFKVSDSNSQNSYKYVGLVLLFVSLFLVSFNYIAYPEFKSIFFNADELMFTGLMKFLSHDGSISNWIFSPGLYFFPDYILAFLSYVLTKNVTVMFLIYLNLQMLLFFYLLQMLYSNFWDINKSIYYAGYCILICVGLAILPFENTSLYQLELFGFFHFGAFLVELMLLNLLFKIYDNNQKKSLGYYSLGFIISAAGVLSDRFIIIWFLIPSIITLAVLYIVGVKNLKSLFIFMCSITFGSFLGILLFGFVSVNTRGGMSLIQLSMGSFIKQFIIMIFYIKGLGLLWIILILFLIAVGISIHMISRNKYFKILIKYSLLFYFISTIIIFLFEFFVPNLRFSTRYSLPVFFIPIFIITPILCRFLKQYQLITLFILILLIPACNKSKAKFSLDSYYPELARCIDSDLSPYDAHKGIANYFDSRLYSVISKQDLDIYAVDGAILKGFLEEEPITIPLNYDFAIINTNPPSSLPLWILNENLIYKINGQPIKRLTNCKDTIILIYKKNGLRINNRD